MGWPTLIFLTSGHTKTDSTFISTVNREPSRFIMRNMARFDTHFVRSVLTVGLSTLAKTTRHNECALKKSISDLAPVDIVLKITRINEFYFGHITIRITLKITNWLNETN